MTASRSDTTHGTVKAVPGQLPVASPLGGRLGGGPFAENRLVSVSGAVTATFVYDGDGRRVKSTIAGTTTYFVGNIYEQTGGTITKYYYLGGTRIAMRQGANVYYLLSDHLGSTTVTTDVNGAQVAELRYKPWGEVRSGAAPTKYTYTGQYSNTTDFGLMFYNARWYDPVLGRFASADSIVPAGVQGLDRYAYANNNPVNYTDPTGHFGNHRDDKSDYWNKGNQRKVKDLEAKWEKEKAEKGLKALVQATKIEVALDPTLALAFGNSSAGAGAECQSVWCRAWTGDPVAILDLLMPTHAGWRLQGEGTLGPVSITVGLNLLFNRIDGQVATNVDGSFGFGPGIGKGVAATTGPLLGWGSSTVRDVVAGPGLMLGASAAAEEAATVSISTPWGPNGLQRDPRYGIAPFTIYAGYGKGGGFADLSLSRSLSFGAVTAPVRWP